MGKKTMRADGAAKIIKSVLIANRGEIAFRISKTLRKMKINVVGLCIPAEKSSSFLSLCNEVHVFQQNELAAYLNIDEIIKVAKATKVDAIHPGYGFLSENPHFAAACEKSGIAFIGPNSATIELMGNKHQAKEFAKHCGIPVLETIVESKENDPAFEKNIQKLRLPIMLKPLSGGGGKGMVIVKSFEDLAKSLAEGRNIALKAFGDSRLLAEPLIEKALHIEVQVIGDENGNVRHLFERDCTIQRRHQKIVEESPSPIIQPEKLEKIFEGAVSLAQKSKYKSLGTVEFILDHEQNFYFMEMNTRLQVEHPVTEITLGLDLVEKQIKIAQGELLDKILPKTIKRKGHAIEVRIYTENPENNFLPSTGTIEYLSIPKESKSLRIDCGIEKGNQVHHSFDPMILKITAHGSSRSKAIDTLLNALQKTVIFGVHTNTNYLQWVLQHPDFAKGSHYTVWTSKTLEDFQKIESMDVTKTIIQSFEKEKTRRQSEWRNDPWLTLEMNSNSIHWKNESFTFEMDGIAIKGCLVETLSSYWISVHGNIITVPKIEIDYEHDEIESSKTVRAPMTGTIVQVFVGEGAHVKKRDVLIEMEAMKMQYKIEATQDGVVSKLNCQPKDIVEQDSVMIELA
jgi:3-methylcrotonyl-CoA carboxylase alpha subunit